VTGRSQEPRRRGLRVQSVAHGICVWTAGADSLPHFSQALLSPCLAVLLSPNASFAGPLAAAAPGREGRALGAGLAWDADEAWGSTGRLQPAVKGNR